MLRTGGEEDNKTGINKKSKRNASLFSRDDLLAVGKPVFFRPIESGGEETMQCSDIITSWAVPARSVAGVAMVLIWVGDAWAADFDCTIYREDAVTLPQGADTPPRPSTAKAKAAELCAKHFAVRLAADPAAKGAASLADTYVVSVGPKDGSAAALKAAAPPLFSAGVDAVKRDLKDVDFQAAKPSLAPAQSTLLVPPGADQQPSIGGPLPTPPRPRFLDPPGVRANGQSLYRMRLDRDRQ